MEIEEHSTRHAGEDCQVPNSPRPLRTSHSQPDVWLEYGVNVEHMGRLLVKSATSMSAATSPGNPITSLSKTFTL